MTADEFRAALLDLSLSQNAFARVLVDMGHPAKDVARSVRRFAKNGAPSEIAVILNIMKPGGVHRLGNAISTALAATAGAPEAIRRARLRKERAHAA